VDKPVGEEVSGHYSIEVELLDLCFGHEREQRFDIPKGIFAVSWIRKTNTDPILKNG
jgi:hypothetical protein